MSFRLIHFVIPILCVECLERGLCSSQFEIKSADSSSTEQYSSNGIQKSSLAYIDRVFGHSVGILTKKTGNSESNKTYPPEKGNSDGNSRIDVPTKSFSASSASNTLSPARIPKHHRRISNEDIALFDRESKDRLEDIASERNNYLELFDDPWLTVLVCRFLLFFLPPPLLVHFSLRFVSFVHYVLLRSFVPLSASPHGPFQRSFAE